MTGTPLIALLVGQAALWPRDSTLRFSIPNGEQVVDIWDFGRDHITEIMSIVPLATRSPDTSPLPGPMTPSYHIYRKTWTLQ